MVKNCLIIDDCSDNRMALVRLLKYLDVRVREAASGQEGLDFCMVAMPDIILLDWMMEPMDGMQFIAALKKHCMAANPQPHFPAIMMCTAKATADDVAYALKNGVSGYLIKPFVKDALIKQMAKLGAGLTFGH